MGLLQSHFENIRILSNIIQSSQQLLINNEQTTNDSLIINQEMCISFKWNNSLIIFKIIVYQITLIIHL